MLIEVKVPQLSESVSEATLLAWHKKQGEAVKRDENLIDIETDKVVLELPAPADGVLVAILKGDKGTVVAGEIIARIDTEGKASAVASIQEKPVTEKPRPAPATPAVGYLSLHNEQQRQLVEAALTWDAGGKKAAHARAQNYRIVSKGRHRHLLTVAGVRVRRARPDR